MSEQMGLQERVYTVDRVDWIGVTCDRDDIPYHYNAILGNGVS